MSNDEASQGESLHEGVRETNSNLQRLLETIGGMLTGSGELLVRLQHILSGTHAATSIDRSQKPETPELPDRRDR